MIRSDIPSQDTGWSNKMRAAGARRPNTKGRHLNLTDCFIVNSSVSDEVSDREERGRGKK